MTTKEQIEKGANEEAKKGRYCTCDMPPELERQLPVGTICPFCIRWRKSNHGEENE